MVTAARVLLFGGLIRVEYETGEDWLVLEEIEPHVSCLLKRELEKVCNYIHEFRCSVAFLIETGLIWTLLAKDRRVFVWTFKTVFFTCVGIFDVRRKSSIWTRHFWASMWRRLGSFYGVRIKIYFTRSWLGSVPKVAWWSI